MQNGAGTMGGKLQGMGRLLACPGRQDQWGSVEQVLYVEESIVVTNSCLCLPLAYICSCPTLTPR